MFNQEALKYLIRCKESLVKVHQDDLNKRWVGRDANSWFESVKNSDYCPNHIKNSSDWDICGLSTDPLNRGKLMEELSELRSSRPISDKAIKKSVIEIFAWGRMRADHARMVLPSIKKYQEICKDLVCTKLNPVDGYKEFFIAYHSKEFKGMGPAYYTKLGAYILNYTTLKLSVLSSSFDVSLKDSVLLRVRLFSPQPPRRVCSLQH